MVFLLFVCFVFLLLPLLTLCTLTVLLESSQNYMLYKLQRISNAWKFRQCWGERFLAEGNLLNPVTQITPPLVSKVDWGNGKMIVLQVFSFSLWEKRWK